MKKIISLVVILVLLAVGIQFGLPYYMSHKIQGQIQETFKPTKTAVSVNSWPAIKILVGKIDSFDAELTGVHTKSGLTFSQLNIQAYEVSVSLKDLYSGSHFVPQSIGHGTIEGVITEQELTAYLKDHVKNLEDASINIRDNEATLMGHFNFAGLLKGTATIHGNIYLNHNCLVFSPKDFSINGLMINGLNTSVLSTIEMYNFDNFPIPVTADKVETENGNVKVYLTPKGIE